jgi:hypothetical protein
MGLFDRFFGKRRESRRERSARSKERRGDLAGAIEQYLDAKLVDDAARLLLLRADAETAADKRLAFCAQAAALAVEPDLKRRARVRHARLKLDILKERGGALPSELSAVGRELSELGEHERAADAFALAGDGEAEVRALTQAGAIERLEERLSLHAEVDRRGRDQELLLRRIEDLDRTAERRQALALADEWLAEHDDERVAELARSIRARLLRGPLLHLTVAGERRWYVLGSEVTVGRAEATVVVPSRSISRRHLRIGRASARHGPPSSEGPTYLVEDLGTRNGTLLRGARVSGALPVGDGLELRLGGEVPCSIRPRPGAPEAGLELEVGGRLFVAPLADLTLNAGGGVWTIRQDDRDDARGTYVCLCSGRHRPYLGDLVLAERIELAVGDALSATRGGPTVVEVLGQDEGSE